MHWHRKPLPKYNSVPQTLKEKINKWDFLKLRNFHKAKDTVNMTKHQPTEWELIFTKPISHRGLISKMYKELKELVIKRTNSPIKIGYRYKQRIHNK